VSSPVFTDERCSLSNCWIQDAAFKGGRISEKALLQAAEAASAQSSTIRLAKDITIYASKGLGLWWEETAGPAPKLLRLLVEIGRGNVSCCRFSFGSTKIKDPPPIIDYWAVTTVHQQMDLADAFVAVALEKRKPRLIITASEKVSLDPSILLCLQAVVCRLKLCVEWQVHNMLVGGQFCLECVQSETEKLLVDNDVDDVDVVKYARSMRKARTRPKKENQAESETGKGKSRDDDDDGDHDDEVKPSTDDDDNNSDPESDDWQDFQQGGFVDLAGSIHVITFGHSRWGVSIGK
jgi:hypothetical protein